MERVEELMKIDHPYCSSYESLRDVCKIFKDNKCSEIFVIDHHKPIGAISEKDIISQCGSGLNPLEMTITDCMHGVPIVINAKMGLENCLTILEHNKLELAPVIDESGNYCGLIFLKDILAEFKE